MYSSKTSLSLIFFYVNHIYKNMSNFKTWLEEENAPNPLDGLSNDAVRKKINRILHGVATGIFSDEYWEGVKIVWKTLDENGIPWTLTSADYGTSPSFAQTFSGPKWRIPKDYKQYNFQIKFINNNQKETTLYGTLIASGAGTMEYPLDKYDITVYVN
jgi:hypothetical protein